MLRPSELCRSLTGGATIEPEEACLVEVADDGVRLGGKHAHVMNACASSLRAAAMNARSARHLVGSFFLQLFLYTVIEAIGDRSVLGRWFLTCGPIQVFRTVRFQLD